MKRILAALAAGLASLALAFPFVAFDTTNVTVTGTAANLTLPTATSTSSVSQPPAVGVRQFVLTNVGTQTVFVRCDGTTATTSNGMPLLANSQVLVSLEKTIATCSAIAGSTGSTLYATVGVGE